MKKTIITIAAAAIATSAFGVPDLSIANRIGYAYPGTATIDGTMGAGEWDSAAAHAANPIDIFIQTGSNSFVEPSNAEDLSGQFWAMWDADGLYILISAKDEAFPFFGGGDPDAFEIYTSAAYTRTFGEWQDPGYDLLSDIQGKFLFGDAGIDAVHGLYSYGEEDPLPESVQHAYTVTDDGYMAEVFIPWTVILGDNTTTGVTFDDGIFYDGPDVAGVGSERNFLGFEVQLQDNDNNTGRETKLSWSGGYEGRIGDYHWADTEVWGTLVLETGIQPPQCDVTDVVLVAPYFSDLGGDFVFNFSTSDYIYTGFCPFVYSFNASNWWYVYEESTDPEGFFVYDFASGAWKFVFQGFVLDL